MKQYFILGDHFHLPAYNFCIALGIAAAMLFLQYNKSFKALSESKQQTIHIAILLAIISGFLGSYIFDTYTQHRPLFNSLQYGLTLLGGVLTGLAVMVIYLKLKRLPIITTLNILTPSFAIAHCFGRIGCFFAGCCFGKPTDTIFGVVFPVNSIPYLHYHALIRIYPTQLFEAAFACIMLLVIYFGKIRNAFYIYFASYAVFRFFIEYIRADDRGNIFGQSMLSPSQIISIVIFIYCIGKFLYSGYYKKTANYKNVI